MLGQHAERRCHHATGYSNAATDAGHSLLTVNNATTNPRFYLTFTNIDFKGAGNSDIGLPRPAFGGALLVYYKVTVNLDNSSIDGYKATGGGGAIALLNADSDPDHFPRLKLYDSTLTRNYTAGSGGAVYSLWGTVQLEHSNVTYNRAKWDGGGLYLGNPEDTGTRENPTSVALRSGSGSTIDDNTAGYNATFSTTRGRGGGIYSASGQIVFEHYQGSPAFQTYLKHNLANEGGAMYVDGPNKPAGGPYASVTAADTVMAYNVSTDKGGAFYSNNAVDWLFISSGGRCLIRAVPPQYRGPCSYLSNNGAFGYGGSTTQANGGVAYITDERTDGASRGIVRFRQTLFEGNQDVNGLAAIAAVGSAGEMVFNRDVFTQNKANMSGNSVLVYSHNGKNVDFRYNTVLDNDVKRMFSMDGGDINVMGSILWGSVDQSHPQHFVWFKSGGATLTHHDCLLIREHDSGLSGIPNIGLLWSGFAPDLDSHYVPRGNSPAIDFCDEPGGYIPFVGIYGNGVRDTPGVNWRWGNHDLGAAEQSDVIFAAGFGKRPNNLDYHHEY